MFIYGVPFPHVFTELQISVRDICKSTVDIYNSIADIYNSAGKFSARIWNNGVFEFTCDRVYLRRSNEFPELVMMFHEY